MNLNLVQVGKFVSVACLTSNLFFSSASAESTSNVTVVINDIKQDSGRVCFRVYSSDKGFPFSSKNEVQSGCVEKTGRVIKKQFLGLKPGNYAVTVIDDRNRDGKLNTDFFGIPQEGFGVSNNPTVSVTTGTPKFSKASFPVNQNTVVNIQMKYSLD
jgi:uncharacterized protein (DUF2141 family)